MYEIWLIPCICWEQLFENETAKQLIRVRKLIVKDQDKCDLLKPDLKTQIQGVVTSEFDHAEFFALAWAAVGLESKFEERILVSGRDESNF